MAAGAPRTTPPGDREMMDWFVKAFLKAALTWLVLGITLGTFMAVYPQWIVYRPAHAHMLLLGFVAMMIFGVAYHVIPRFTGNPLHSRRAPAWHWWMSNLGLANLAIGFALRAHGLPAARWALLVGGTLAAAGAYTFAYVIWRTIDGSSAQRAAARRAESLTAAAPSAGAPGRPQLPLAQLRHS
jgi:cbb3-type cytochrome oxidase subunit 1